MAEVHLRATHRELRVQAGASDNVTEEELFDIEEQRNRLSRMFCFDRGLDTLLIEPSFPGCGMIDAGKGDLIYSKALFEIKAGDRLFRSVDVRQLIIYSALNFVSNRFQIDSLGLFNPRVGISATISVDDLCTEISGKKSGDLFFDIVAAVSSGDISR
ncbi:TNF domain-containing protein [Bradyrhizobium sp. 5.13L]